MIGKISSVLLALLILISPYRFFGFFNLSTVISLIALFLYVLVRGSKVRIEKSLLLFGGSVVLVYIINFIRLGSDVLSILNFLIGGLLTIVLINGFSKTVNYLFFIKIYRFIVVVSSIVLVYQAILLFLFDIPAVPINLFPVPPEDMNLWGQFKGERPSSFFTEPQAFVSFVLPYVLHNLYYKESKGVFILVLVAILLSTSTLGLIMSIMILVYYIFNSDLNVLNLIGLILISVIVVIGVDYFGLLDRTLIKFNETNFDNNIRITNGFEIYGSLEEVDKVFGISQDLHTYVLENVRLSWVNLYRGQANEYLVGYTTSFSGMLIHFGIIPMFFLIRVLWLRFRFNYPFSRALIFVIAVLSFAQTIVFNPWFVFYFSVLFVFINNERKRNEENWSVHNS